MEELQKNTDEYDNLIDSNKTTTKLNSNKHETYLSLGFSLEMLGKYDEGLYNYQQALKINPDDPIVIYRIGQIYLKKEEVDNAEKAFKKVVSLSPNFFKALINLALIYRQKGLLQKVVLLYKKALLIKPDFADLYNNLGNIHSELGDMSQALECYQRATNINPAHYQAFFNMGNILKKKGKFDTAVLSYKQAIYYKSDFYQAMIEIGNIHRIKGRKEAALLSYNDAISVNNKSVAPYRYISALRKFKAKDKYISEMESLLNDSDVSQADKIILNFSLGKAYEDLKQYDLAFQYFKKGNCKKRDTIRYDRREDDHLFEKIKNIFSKTFLKTRLDWGLDDSTPIFIIGMPRSGTSLVEQIVATHSDVYGAGELSMFDQILSTYGKKILKSSFPEFLVKFSQADYEAIGKTYINSLRELNPGIKFITDKMPQNFLFTGVIRIIFPHAKIIHCVRNPMDNCFSIFKSLFSDLHRYAYDLSEIEHYYKLYYDLMNHWRNVMPGFIYDIHYEKLVMESEKQVKRLLKFCGLNWDLQCLSFYQSDRPVLTASTAQVRRPFYRDSIELWRKYEKNIKRILNITQNTGSNT
jgi:tetratricopeptide (TPR) repeat protein